MLQNVCAAHDIPKHESGLSDAFLTGISGILTGSSPVMWLLTSMMLLAAEAYWNGKEH